MVEQFEMNSHTTFWNPDRIHNEYKTMRHGISIYIRKHYKHIIYFVWISISLRISISQPWPVADWNLKTSQENFKYCIIIYFCIFFRSKPYSLRQCKLRLSYPCLYVLSGILASYFKLKNFFIILQWFWINC